MGHTALKRDPPDVDGGNAMQSFRDWLSSPVIEVSIRRQHDQYYAVAPLFDLAGVGKTEGEALRDLTGLLEAYLRSCFNEGRPYSEAVRAPRKGLIRNLMSVGVGVVERVLERRRQLVLPSALHPSI